MLVKLLRDRDVLTQEQLAEKLGLSRLTIQNLESGKNNGGYCAKSIADLIF